MHSDNELVLAINVGSSTVKAGAYELATRSAVLELHVDRPETLDIAFAQIEEELSKAMAGPIAVVGHRVAHGGSDFCSPVVIDAGVEAAIERASPLAPQHNPQGLAGIRAARQRWPGVPHVAVFDTGFHSAMPAYASTYAVPAAWRQAGLKRYGFHGISHERVMHAVADRLGVPASHLRIVSCHLGNGASVCAIDRGVSVDTSMGMTALEGLVMGSRSGDLDPGAYGFLMRTLGLTCEQVETALYEDSGLKGLSGGSTDLRDVQAQALLGNTDAQLALQVFAYRVRKYIGAYAAAMGGCEVVAFTGGIGERSSAMRQRICQGLEFLGMHLDQDLNETGDGGSADTLEIQRRSSVAKLMVIRAREEWMIADHATRLVAATKAGQQRRQVVPIPVAVSAHHVHLTQAAVEKLFGPGYQLRVDHELRQPGFWAACETVDLETEHGRIAHLRVLGPCRAANQIEIARSEAVRIGVDAPLRLSGDTEGTPPVTLIGPAGRLSTKGLIVARRHVHASPQDAERIGARAGAHLEVSIDTSPRATSFAGVALRISPGAALEMHIDTDEANAAGIAHGGAGVLAQSGCHAVLCTCAL